MSDIEWFDKTAGSGELPMQVEPGTVVTLHGDAQWVRCPPEAGGGVARIDRIVQAPCPCMKEVCRTTVLRRQIKGRTLYVAECNVKDTFMWYTVDTDEVLRLQREHEASDGE